MTVRTGRLRGALLPALVGCVAVLVVASASAATPKPPGLFSERGMTAAGALPAQAKAGKSLGVTINYGQLRSGRFFVDLPGGVSFEAVREQMEDFGGGRLAWVGSAGDDPDSRVVLGASGDAVAGTFAYHGKLFKLEPRADGSHVLSEVETGDPAPLLEPVAVGNSADGGETAPASGAAAAGAVNTNIDVLVAYTPAVEAQYGAAGAQALVIQAVAETNQAYGNSKMSTQLKLVHAVRTQYVESGSMNTDLSRLRGTADGYMDGLHALRDSYGADVVSLIENEPQYCGIAYRMATLSTGFASSAFSVVHHSCATGYFSFGHEIGHNQGAHHDHANASGTAIYPYAYGYQDPDSNFRTIMAYDCPGGCTRVGQFSHGDNVVYGLSTGVPGWAENARAIDETAPTVGAFRQSVAQLPPAPSGLAAVADSQVQVSLAWTDNSSNETEFLVERSEDGVNFSQVGSLPADTATYTDAGLSAQTLYSYRVRARNAAGNSPYSEVAVATTPAFPEFTDHFAIAESSRVGTVSGSAADTHVDDGVSESIREVTSAGLPGESYSELEHYWTFDVSPGETITLYIDVDTEASGQSFTFAYSTTLTTLKKNPGAWVDMFTVDAGNPGMKQFTLPASLNGLVSVSVRDTVRVAGTTTADQVNIDYLTIRTSYAMGLPPGC